MNSNTTKELNKATCFLSILSIFTVFGLSAFANARQKSTQNQEFLIKFKDPAVLQSFMSTLSMAESKSTKPEALTDKWLKLEVSQSKGLEVLEILSQSEEVEYIQPNYAIKLLDGYSVDDPLKYAAIQKGLANMGIEEKGASDNPVIPNAPISEVNGADPMISKQWGMIDLGAPEVWKTHIGSPDMIVAVLDTGVDYTHEDLLPNLWRNNKEIPNNQIDDDNNGFIDDIIGWDFAANDNKPYDLKSSQNPGHGTHCAGNIAARGANSTGISGVAPNVKIMSLRFISEKGAGTTADAVKAIRYAVENGAKILSNSWGSEGEDTSEPTENKALRDIIQFAEDSGVLFVAAAGNGHKGKGYNNDTDANPAFPASYDHESIISVAALDKNDKLGSFSNWGLKSVDIGAPGVAVFSTVVGNGYSATVFPNLPFVTWDGTSMATPHVAGAAALYWSANPTASWKEVKEAILKSAKKIPSLNGKVVSQGKLNLTQLMRRKKH